ncbi:MAG: DUF559 domain-containing protein [Chloroflexota bacterium]
MSRRGEMLVAIMNDQKDMTIAREQQWYRIPVASVKQFLKNGWPPDQIAFYQTKEFGVEAHAVNYYARVLDVREVPRVQLFPDEPPNEKSQHHYFQLRLSPLTRLRRPIISRRWRRIVFIPTTLAKFARAVEINDLYDESPLEDMLWTELRQCGIDAERQEFVQIGREFYALDFAVYCRKGKLDLETDGDTWHIERSRAAQDNQRDNDLETEGWSLLRFSTRQIKEELTDYCVPKIAENIKRLGGLESQKRARPKPMPVPTDWRQLALFD